MKQETMERIRKFTADREWEQYHTPSNLAKSIAIEAAELGIREDQIMVGGESAGGGLTVAVCMMARDRKEVPVAFQMPLYPMLSNIDTETLFGRRIILDYRLPIRLLAMGNHSMPRRWIISESCKKLP